MQNNNNMDYKPQMKMQGQKPETEIEVTVSEETKENNKKTLEIVQLIRQNLENDDIETAMQYLEKLELLLGKPAGAEMADAEDQALNDELTKILG